MKTREQMKRGEAAALLELGCLIYTSLHYLRKSKCKKMWSELSLQKRAAMLARWIEPPNADEEALRLRTVYLQRNFAIIFKDGYKVDDHGEDSVEYIL